MSILPHLAPRERELLRGLSEGKQLKQVAAEMGVSYNGLHVRAIALYAKIGVADKHQAALLAPRARANGELL